MGGACLRPCPWHPRTRLALGLSPYRDGGTRAPCWGTPVCGLGGGDPGGGDREQPVTPWGSWQGTEFVAPAAPETEGGELVLPFLGVEQARGRVTPNPGRVDMAPLAQRGLHTACIEVPACPAESLYRGYRGPVLLGQDWGASPLWRLAARCGQPRSAPSCARWALGRCSAQEPAICKEREWGGHLSPSKSTLCPHASMQKPKGRMPVFPSSPSAGHLPHGVPGSASRRHWAWRCWRCWALLGNPAHHWQSPRGQSWGRSRAAWGAGPLSLKQWP